MSKTSRGQPRRFPRRVRSRSGAGARLSHRLQGGSGGRVMKPAVGRLLLTAVLFVGWLGYLGYLVRVPPAHARRSPRRVRGPAPHAVAAAVPRVHARCRGPRGQRQGRGCRRRGGAFSQRESARESRRRRSTSPNIDKCRPLPDPLAKDGSRRRTGRGPGHYHSAAANRSQRNGERHFKVVPTPPSPGYPPRLRRWRHQRRDRRRIYPATPEMLAEYQEIAKPK